MSLGSPTPAGHCQTWMKVKFFGEEALTRRLTSEYKVQGFRNPWSSRTHLCQALGAEAVLPQGQTLSLSHLWRPRTLACSDLALLSPSQSPCTLTLSHSAAPTPGLSHRTHVHTHTCTLIHVKTNRVMMTEVTMTFHPKLLCLEAGRRGDFGSKPPGGERILYASLCLWALRHSHRWVCPQAA